MAERILGVFETSADALRAVRGLVGAGIPRDGVIIGSTEPILDPEFLASEDRKTRMPLWAIAGAILGCAIGYSLTATAAQLMGLAPGGQPIVSLWAFAIVIFELTALGAIGGTVITFFRETGLPQRRSAVLDAQVARTFADAGFIVGAAVDRSEQVEMVDRVLREVGAKEVKYQR